MQTIVRGAQGRCPVMFAIRTTTIYAHISTAKRKAELARRYLE
jgi:hypothetical protein